jgi:hypothetical protein
MPPAYMAAYVAGREVDEIAKAAERAGEGRDRRLEERREQGVAPALAAAPLGAAGGRVALARCAVQLPSGSAGRRPRSIAGLHVCHRAIVPAWAGVAR